MQTAFAGSARDYRVWLSKIQGTHERRIEFLITPLDGGKGVWSTVRPMFLEGSISMDSSRNPSRILDVTFLDPDEAFSLEPDDGTTPVHRSRVITVRWSVRVPELGRWVTCRPFTGPIVDIDREGPTIKLTAHGFDEQGMGEVAFGHTFKKKASKATALRWLANKWGEKKIAIPKKIGSFPTKFTVAATDKPWERARKIVSSVNRQMFYNGKGQWIYRANPSRSVLTIDRNALLSPVTIDRNADFKNRWVVIGAKVGGKKKKKVRASAQLPASNPLAPGRLSRNGEPLFHLARVENTAYKTTAACQRRANEMRNASLRTTANYSFDCIPMPHLDENDVITVRSREGTIVVRASQWTLPLGNAAMSIGTIKRASTKATRRRPSGKPSRSSGERKGKNGSSAKFYNIPRRRG